MTLPSVVTSGRPGDLWRAHSLKEFDDPRTMETGPTGGLLRDVDSDLIDQILWLLGPVASV